MPNRPYQTFALAALCVLALPAAAVGVSISVTDEAGAPLKDAVVYAMVAGAKAAPTKAPAEMAQRARVFDPFVLPVQVGTLVNFPNFDTVRHHVYSFSKVKPFELKLYAGTPSEPLLFDKPGTAVLGCNIHDRMSAYIHVVDTPYFTKTDAAGNATLDVPAGAHQLMAWHWRMGEGKPAVALPMSAPSAAPITVKLGGLGPAQP